MSKQDGKLTGLFGAPVSDRENSMTAGQRGPLLMQDVYYLEQISHFDREVIPERRACERFRCIWYVHSYK